MVWGYKVERGISPLPLKLEIDTYCHALITGASGSGKSYALLYLIGMLLQDNTEIAITICDFKNSADFEFLKNYPHYYGGNDCYEGIMNYYKDFCDARIQKAHNKRHLLIVDEYPALINYLSSIDKRDKTKKAGDILSAVAEILMLGRGINYGVWIVTQRADATLFANGARDNFMIVLGLGRMSKEQKGMIFPGEEVPNRLFQKGEGCLLADGHPLVEVKFPKIKSVISWKKYIKCALLVV